VVDGGKGQLGVARRVVESLGLADEIPVAGLAKRFEEVFVPGQSDPVEIPRGSEALFMLQRIRDEAHRFANTFHVERRSKRMTASSLDGIPGLGETRKTKLVKAMGGVNAVKRADLEDLKSLPFLPDAVAEAIHARFARVDAGGPPIATRRSDEVGGDLGVEAVDPSDAIVELATEVPLRDDELVESQLDVPAERVDQFGRRADDGPPGGSVGA
jgi:hypothetical protein